jgi:hypothetical protein
MGLSEVRRPFQGFHAVVDILGKRHNPPRKLFCNGQALEDWLQYVRITFRNTVVLRIQYVAQHIDQLGAGAKGRGYVAEDLLMFRRDPKGHRWERHGSCRFGDPAVLRIGSIIWIVRVSQRTREHLVGIGYIAERQCDGSFKRRR